MRSTRWYSRELERRDRIHAQERFAAESAWYTERTKLIETICRLAGKPTYEPADTPPDDDGDLFDELDALQRPAPAYPSGDGLLTYQPEE